MEEIMQNEAVGFVMLPKAKLDEITSGLKELKDLITGKAEKDADAGWVESSDARKLLGVSQKTWQVYRDKRVLPFSQFGRKIYVKRTDIEAFLESHKIKN